MRPYPSPCPSPSSNSKVATLSRGCTGGTRASGTKRRSIPRLTSVELSRSTRATTPAPTPGRVGILERALASSSPPSCRMTRRPRREAPLRTNRLPRPGSPPVGSSDPLRPIHRRGLPVWVNISRRRSRVPPSHLQNDQKRPLSKNLRYDLRIRWFTMRHRSVHRALLFLPHRLCRRLSAIPLPPHHRTGERRVMRLDRSRLLSSSGDRLRRT